MTPELLAVLNPPAEDRDRTEMLKLAAVGLPPVAKWREGPTVGLSLAGHRIVSNHFRLDVTKIPGPFYHYHVHIFRADRDGVTILRDIDCAVEEDPQVNCTLINKLKDTKQWGDGITYDGRSSLFSSTSLHSTGDENAVEFIAEPVPVLNTDGMVSKKMFFVTLSFIETVSMPQSSNPSEWGRLVQQTAIRALDTPILMSARWAQQTNNPEWMLVGSKAFPRDGQMSAINRSYVALRGYYASLKACMAGLVLVCDMSVSCFLSGGPMVEVMCHAGGFNNVRDMTDSARERRGLHNQVIAQINGVIKGTRVIAMHLKQRKKAKSLGPAANSEESRFEDPNGVRMTVAEYFQNKYGTPLKYPDLPTINVGSAKKPILFPPEVLMVPNGQCRAQRMTGDMTATMIRYAAVRPDERQRYITGTESIVHVVRSDPITAAFGVSNISAAPMVVPATLLPPARIRYGGNVEIDPVLAGAWNINRNKFITAPPNATNGAYMYGIMIISDREPQNWRDAVKRFEEELERDARDCGLKLRPGGTPITSSSRSDEVASKLTLMKRHGARIVVVMLVTDAYNLVKLEADRMGLPTQCLRWKNVDRPPRGYHANVLLKINTKLGGTNHTLVSRLPRNAPPVSSVPLFQDPPASLCWVMDKPCMLVGIDVSHAEPGSDRESTAAVVGSMNGQASQYVAHVSSQAARVEMVAALTDAMVRLMTTFKERNNQAPEHIVVFRDGVSDGQFEQVIAVEVEAVKTAMELSGYMDDKIKIAYVICQKGHHTRLVYENGAEFINLCPGVVLDSSCGSSAITSAQFNEFYLNSHVSIQGTSKPCKYVLVYDSIGLKMPELELLTYWSTYLYARCNRSVSIATPAYYAHWASRRAKNLCAAGASSNDLLTISQTWAGSQMPSMFFI